eukprot:2205928-Rhodomonas_salina.3
MSQDREAERPERRRNFSLVEHGGVSAVLTRGAGSGRYQVTKGAERTQPGLDTSGASGSQVQAACGSSGSDSDA